MATKDVSGFLGYWKITEMEVWAPEYIDLVVPGFIEFTYEDGLLMGMFQFGTVSGGLDCRLRDIDAVTHVEWSWDGQSDTDPGCGRGWARLVDGDLVGRIFIHGGDDSAFRAKRKPRPAAPVTSTRERPREKGTTPSRLRYH